MEKIEDFSKELNAYKTSKNLFVFIPKMELASSERPATIYDPDYSKIGILVQDYSQGKGDKNVIVRCNISIGQAEWLYERSKLCVDFSFPGDINQSLKIFGTPEKDGKYKGLCPCTKITINRQSKNNKGEAKKYKYYICVENGYGEKVMNSNGSCYCGSNTYKIDKKVFINMSDEDFFCKISEVHNHIQGFISAFAPSVIRNEYKYIWDYKKELENERNSNNTSKTSSNNNTTSNNTSSAAQNTQKSEFQTQQQPDNNKSTSQPQKEESKPTVQQSTVSATENTSANTTATTALSSMEKDAVQEIFMSTTTLKNMQQDGNFKIGIISKDNLETELIFLKKYLDKEPADKWNNVLNKLNRGKCKFTCRCFFANNRYYFVDNIA